MARWIQAVRDAATAPLLLVELFVLANLAFLAVDVLIAHSINAFASPAEYVPLLFSIVSPVLLVMAMVLARSPLPPLSPGQDHPRRAGDPGRRAGYWLGVAVGYGAVGVGIAGLVLHLESSFFEEQTIENLVYAAPFAAPLAYAGLGLLILADRMVPAETAEWARWVVFLALGGFVGNFALSLADHAQNGFFNQREWIPVVAAAFAIGALWAVMLDYDNRPYLWLCQAVMLGQIVVGFLGWGYHLHAIARSGMDTLWQKVLYSAPLFAPLLFANLAILGMLGLWALQQAAPATQGEGVRT